MEKLLMWLPIIGWTVAAALEKARFRPMVRTIDQQLRERPDTSEQWGSDPRRQEISATVRSLIAEELGWPNDHFIPDDPFGIAFWGHQDGLDDVSAAMRIEKQFGFRLPDSEWERFWCHGTLGEFVDRLIAHERKG
jgi:acyl carrier protein